jgi:type I restriction enzyme S subunit
MEKYREYKNSEVKWFGDMPKHWVISSFRFCISILTDYTANGSFATLAENVTYLENGFSRLIRLTDLRVDMSNAGIYIDEKAHNFLKKSELFGGELLIANVGAYAGLVCLMPKVPYKSTLGPNMFLLRLKFHPKYFYYLLNSPPCAEQLKIAAVSSAQPKLNKDNIKQLRVIQPSMDEQILISKYLDHKTIEIDKLISDKERLIELLNEERIAIINHAVTKGINPNLPIEDKGIDWLGKIPKHWQLKKIKYLNKKIGSGVTPKGGAEVYQTSGIPLLRSQNIYFDGLRLEDVAYISEEIHESMSGSTVYPLDVLINITGGSIGRCFYMTNEFIIANVNQHVCIIRPNQLISTQYLYNLLRSSIGQMQIEACQTGGNRESLNFEQLKNFIFPIPNIDEQQEILLYIDFKENSLNSLILKTQSEIELLKEYKIALISEVVTGKVDVRNEVVTESMVTI